MYTILENYTPHPVTLVDSGGISQELPSLGHARAAEVVLSTTTLAWDPFGDAGMSVSIPCRTKHYDEVQGLPPPRKHVLYIVSTLVMQAAPERTDLVAPDELIRDASSGRIIGARGVYRFPAR